MSRLTTPYLVRLAHRRLHGSAVVVMDDKFCVGWLCPCGAYLWKSRY